MVKNIFILDKHLKTDKVLTVNGKNAFFDDIYTLDLSTGTETYEFSTTITEINESNYVMFYYHGKYKLFQIVEIEQEHAEGDIVTTVYAETACLELLNNVVRSFEGEYNAISFLEHVLEGSEWAIGEYSSSLAEKVVSVKVDKTTQKWSCIQDYMGDFGYEISPRVIYDNGHVKAKLIDVYSEGGLGDHTYKRFEYGYNVTGIVKKKDLYDWCTALIIDTDKDVTNVEYNEGEYIKKAGSDVVLAANENRKYNLGRDYIYSNFEAKDCNDATDAVVKAIEELKRRATPRFDYECTTALTYREYDDLNLGDTVYCIDHTFSPSLTLEARVGKLELSFSDRTKCRCTLTNYKEVKSKIDMELTGTIQQIVGSYFPITSDGIANGAITDGKIETTYYQQITSDIVSASKVVAEELIAKKIIAVDAKFENLNSKYATIENLNVTNGNITTLTSNLADITTLVNGNLTSDNIQSMVITGDKFTVANGFIKNAMIESINANKINTGTINTNNVKIQSADGSMVINGTTQQFKDKNNKVRIQIGKDAQGNFTFALFSQDGVGVLIDETGIKSGAVPNGLIVNNMVSDSANISGSKLDINSVISSINNGTTTIKGTRIQLDEQGQSLQVAFSQLKSKVETIENVSIDGDLSSVIEQVTSNTTSINTMQGQISSLISNTTITKDNGEVVQLKDAYSSTKQTVDSMTSKIGSIETTIKSTLKSTVAEYYVSTSNTSQTGGSWSTTSPTWQSGKYIWQRMKYTYTDNSIKYSTAVCIQGAKGEQGAKGDKGDRGLQGLQGERGEQGIKGDKGEKGDTGSNGKTTYFHIKYSVNPNGNPMTETPSEYIGTYVDYTETDSTDYRKYKWAKFKGDQGVQGPTGEQGIPGTNGADGKTYYLHIKYSNDAGKTFTSNNGETPGDYIGVYTDTTQADSTNVSKYTWSKIKGDQGPQGVPGTNGKDGKPTYTWIKYADDTNGNGISNDPTGKKYIGFAYNKTTATESTNASDYTWSLIKGDKGDTGVQGPKGTDGKTTYTWIKYSDNSDGTGLYDTPKSTTKYIGIATNKTTATESTNKSDYVWSQFKGDKGDKGDQGIQGLQGPRGEQGIQGPAGKNGTNGKTTYFHIKYSSNANGNPMTETPSTYIGTYVDYTATDSTDYTKYTWSRFQGLQGAKGDQGIPGKNGSNGNTYYLHIKYSNDGGKTFTSNNGETPGTYIGVYTDTTAADSTSVSKYTWSKVKGDKGDTGAKGDKGTTGEKGQSLTKSTPQWYSSTSNTSQTGGSWVESMPTLEQGKYIWLRYKLTWANPTATTYTTPTLEMVAEAVKTVSSKQTSLEQNLNGFKQTVSDTYTTKADFNNLTIGGTNLVSGTKNFDGWSYGGFTLQNNVYDGTFKGCYIKWTGTSEYKDVAKNSSVYLEPNTEYTLSFWAKGTGKFWSYLYHHSNAVVSSGYNSSGDTTTSIDGAITTTLSDNNKFKRYWITWKTRSDLTPGKCHIIPCRVAANRGNCEIVICGIKFEKGNKATAWTPAPEDIDASITAVDSKFASYSTTSQMNSAINQKANEITSTVSETYATKASVTDVSNNLKNNYSTTSAMNSAINQKANEITSSVSSTYATKTSLKATDDKFANYSTTSQMNSAINQKGDSILSTVSSTYTTKTDFNNLSIGGTNLWVLGDLQAGHETNGNITGNSNPAHQIRKTLIPTNGNKYITYQVWNTNKVTNDSNINRIAFFDINKTYISSTGLPKLNGTSYQTALYNMPSNAAYVRLGAIVGLNSIDSGIKVKFEFGNKTTGWTPAPEDIDNKFANYSTTSQMNSAIKQKSDSILSTVSNTYTTKADFNNLNVGGRNFVINSGFKGTVPDTQTFPYWDHWGNVKVYANQGKTGYNAINTLYLANNTTTSGGIYQDISSTKIPKNTQITISYDMIKEANVKGSFTSLEFFNTSNTKLGTIILSSATGHIIKTVTTPNYDYSKMRFIIGHDGSDSSNGGYLVDVGNVKIEKGNKATDWSPAPEDVDNKFANYPTTKQMESKITQTAQGINTEVSKKLNSADLSSRIQQSPNDIKIGFNKINNFITIDPTNGLQVNHEDGSYTRISAGGLSLYQASTGYRYKCLVTTGYFSIKGKGTSVITLPAQFDDVDEYDIDFFFTIETNWGAASSAVDKTCIYEMYANDIFQIGMTKDSNGHWTKKVDYSLIDVCVKAGGSMQVGDRGDMFGFVHWIAFA